MIANIKLCHIIEPRILAHIVLDEVEPVATSPGPAAQSKSMTPNFATTVLVCCWQILHI